MIEVQHQQVLVPKQVYIGDAAELRCSFSSNSSDLKALVQNGAAELSISDFTEPLDLRDFEIKNITLIPSGVDYFQLTITFVPWKTGEIQFPSYCLNEMLFNFEPVTIVSITQQNKISTLQELSSPLLLPGTTYKLYGFVIFVVIALFFAIKAIVQYKKVMFFIKNLKLKLKYRKNARSTIKSLMALAEKVDGVNDAAEAENQLSQKDAASEMQKIMRNYLEVRFAYPFTKTVTSELMKGFSAATLDLLSEEKELAFETFVAAFVRTDFIRYSAQGSFERGEVKQLVQNLVEKIGVIEKPDVEKSDDGKDSVVSDDAEDKAEDKIEDKVKVEDEDGGGNV